MRSILGLQNRAVVLMTVLSAAVFVVPAAHALDVGPGDPGTETWAVVDDEHVDIGACYDRGRLAGRTCARAEVAPHEAPPVSVTASSEECALGVVSTVAVCRRVVAGIGDNGPYAAATATACVGWNMPPEPWQECVRLP